MTPRFLTMALLAMACGAFNAQAQSSLTVSGKIDGVKQGQLLIVAQVGENLTDTLGVADFKSPKFEIKAKVSEPVMARLVVKGYGGGFDFIAEPGATYQALLRDGDGAYIKGGRLHDEWSAFYKRSTEMHAEAKAMEERCQALRAANKFRSASATNDSLRALRDSIKTETNGFLASHDDVITAYTYNANALMAELNLADTRRLYDRMGEGAKNSPSGRIMLQRIRRMEKVAQGRKAPDFSLPDINGNTVTLSQVKAKIKIVDFWASWCGPCRLNNPSLKKFYAQYHDRGLEIISVSLDNVRTRWEKAVKDDALPWINVSSLEGWKCDVARTYDVKAVPAIFILDAENHIIATNIRGEALANFLKEKL